MRIISALHDAPGRDYQTMAENLYESALKFGHRVCIYPLHDDPVEEFINKGNYKTSCFFKPHLILKALDDTKEDILWLDVDCLVNGQIDNILGEYDVAVTLRRGSGLRDIYDGYLNAGVMAFRNNAAAREFIKRWIAYIPGSRADQDALNKVLIEHTLFENHDITVDCGCARVIVRSCDEYNFFYFPEPDQARIYHVKGSLRPEFYNRYATMVLGDKASLIGVK